MKVSFIIPFHNEEKNCLPMIDRVLEYGKRKKISFEVIPVDDRSKDGTRKLLMQAHKKNPTSVFPVYRENDEEEKGNTMGKALVEGTNSARGDIVIWTMGDLADDTATYGKIIDKINNGCDMVFGSRYMSGGSRGNLDPIKAYLSSSGTHLARFLFNMQVHDITNAFRGFKKTVFERLTLQSSGFSISPEFAIKAHLAGFKLDEVPTVYTNRVEGVSNFKMYTMTRHYLSVYFDLFFRYKLLSNQIDFIVS